MRTSITAVFLLLGLMIMAVAVCAQQQPAPQTPAEQQPSGINPASASQQGQQPASGETQQPPAVQPIYAPAPAVGEQEQQPAPPPPPATGAEGLGLGLGELAGQTYLIPSLRYVGNVRSGTGSSTGSDYQFNSNAAASLLLQHSFSAGSVHYAGVAAYRSQYAHVIQAHSGGFNLGKTFGRWTLSAMDQATYTPVSAFGTAGLGGLGNFGSFGGMGLGAIGAGIGSVDALSGGLNSGLLPDQSVLVDGSRVSNSAVLQTQYALSARNSLTAYVNQGLMRGISNDALKFDSYQGSFGFSRRISEANSWGLQYGFARFQYPAADHVDVQSMSLVFQRQLTGRLRLHSQGGVQVSSYLQQPAGQLHGVHGMASVGLVYQRGRNSFATSFGRRLAGGSGVFHGTNTTHVQFTASRQFTRTFSAALLGGFALNNPLDTNRDIYTSYAGVELDRSLGRQFNAFFRYDLQRQWGDLGACQFASCSAEPIRNLFAFGITWSFPGWRM